MSEPLVCPACGGTNLPDAVFCADPACHKALGDFRYAAEEFLAKTRWYERVADRVADFVGRPHFLVIHALWFLFWVLLNTGILAMMAFDEYPFGLLGIVLSIEAIFMTGFLLISGNRQQAHANLRGELDYEVNVRTFRRITEMETKLDAILRRLDALETPPDRR